MNFIFIVSNDFDLLSGKILIQTEPNRENFNINRTVCSKNVYKRFRTLNRIVTGLGH